MNYWKESIEEALSEIGISATADQTKELVEWVQGSHDNYGMAMGHDVASANWESDESKELKRMKAEAKKTLQWELETKPCRNCTTTGTSRDGWGRDAQCPDCYGKGRI